MLFGTGTAAGWIFLSLACAIYAARTGRSGAAWFFLSIALSPIITLALLLALGPLKESKQSQYENKVDTDNNADIKKEIETISMLSGKRLMKEGELSKRLEKIYIQLELTSLEDFDQLLGYFSNNGYDQILSAEKISNIRESLIKNDTVKKVVIGENSYNFSKHWLLKNYAASSYSLMELIKKNIGNRQIENQDGSPLLYSDAAKALNLGIDTRDASKFDQEVLRLSEKQAKERKRSEKIIANASLASLGIFAIGLFALAALTIKETKNENNIKKTDIEKALKKNLIYNKDIKRIRTISGEGAYIVLGNTPAESGGFYIGMSGYICAANNKAAEWSKKNVTRCRAEINLEYINLKINAQQKNKEK